MPPDTFYIPLDKRPKSRMLPDYAERFFTDCRSLSDVTVFVGAGISVPSPSGAPTWNGIRDALLDALLAEAEGRFQSLRGSLPGSHDCYDSTSKAKRAEESEVALTSVLNARSMSDTLRLLTVKEPLNEGSIEDWSLVDSRIRERARHSINTRRSPEALFEVIKANLSNEHAISDLVNCVNLGRPNENHFSLAWAAAHRQLKYILTTNFDTYLEQALEQLGLTQGREVSVVSTFDEFGEFVKNDHPLMVYVVKLHGSIAAPASLQVALSDIRMPPQPILISALTRTLRDKAVIYWGYSARDPDILPKLLQEMTKSRLTVFGLFGSSTPPQEIEEIATKTEQVQIARSDRSLLIELLALQGMDAENPAANIQLQTPARMDTAVSHIQSWVHGLDDAEVLSCLGDLYSYLAEYDAARTVHQAALTLATSTQYRGVSGEREMSARLSIADACHLAGKWAEEQEQVIFCRRVLEQGIQFSPSVTNRLITLLLRNPTHFDVYSTFVENVASGAYPGTSRRISVLALKTLAFSYVQFERFDDALRCCTEALRILISHPNVDLWLEFMDDLQCLYGHVTGSIGKTEEASLARVVSGCWPAAKELLFSTILSGDIECLRRDQIVVCLAFLMGSLLEERGEGGAALSWFAHADALKGVTMLGEDHYG